MKPIPKLPGLFATEQGEIYTQEGQLVPASSDGKYLRIYHHGQKYRVHRLILETFVGPCPPGMEACHGNGIRTDNRLENLRWDTRKANCADAVRHGTCPGLGSRFGEVNPAAKLTHDQVSLIRAAYADGAGTQKDFADMFGVAPSTIAALLSGHNWPAEPSQPEPKPERKSPAMPRIGG